MTRDDWEFVRIFGGLVAGLMVFVVGVVWFQASQEAASLSQVLRHAGNDVGRDLARAPHRYVPLVDELAHLTADVLAFDQSKLGNSVDRAHFAAVYIHLGKLRKARGGKRGR